MFVLNQKVKIGKNEFKRVHNIEIVSMVKKLQDTCIIKVPPTAILKDDSNNTSVEWSKEIKKREDRVFIDLGYGGDKNLRREFEGVVVGFNYKNPLEIRCEDNTYYFKEAKLPEISHKKITLKKLLKEILGYVKGHTFDYDCTLEMEFTNFRIGEGVSVFSVLQKLIDTYHLSIYLKEPFKLYVGIPFKDNGDSVVYHMQKNIVSSSLEYQEEDDIKVKLKVIGIDKKNKTTFVYVPDKDAEGGERSYVVYDFEDIEKDKKEAQKKLKELGELRLPQIKYTGYKGSFKGFLIPYCKPNYIVDLRDDKYPERSGSFYVKSVKTTYGRNGGRRDIELGIKVGSTDKK